MKKSNMEVEKKQEGNSALKKATFLRIEKTKKKTKKKEKETVDTHTNPTPLHEEEKEKEETFF